MRKKITYLALVVVLSANTLIPVVASAKENNIQETVSVNDEDILANENEEEEIIEAIKEAVAQIEEYTQFEYYVVDLINEAGASTTIDDWEFNLNYLKDNYDEISSNEDINIDYIDFYIGEYESELNSTADPDEGANPISVNTRAYIYYNRSAAVSYALKYWDTFNSAYPNWTSSGGDCANFVSQCLYAGGEKMVGSTGASNATVATNWFSSGTAQNTSNVSSSWRGANAFKNCFVTKAKYYKRFDSSSTKTTLSNYAKVGDAVSFYSTNASGSYIAKHTMIVVGFSSGDTILAGHTGPTKTTSLYTTLQGYDGCYIYSMK